MAVSWGLFLGGFKISNGEALCCHLIFLADGLPHYAVSAPRKTCYWSWGDGGPASAVLMSMLMKHLSALALPACWTLSCTGPLAPSPLTESSLRGKGHCEPISQMMD